ncbi:uncharacterized protein TNCV_2868401 [Trichonephila clavipes]|nr:uncharacterized protein TNCV_2868401 [Trichonephila clavipes]
MVFLNEVLTEFRDDIPLAAIQRHWSQHDGAPAHFCAPDWLDIAYPGRWPSQGTGVSRRTDNTNGLSYSSACCFTSVHPAVLRHVMKAIPLRAQACLDMHGGHFEHLP